jgi:signal transduction histidine kinase
MESDAVSHSVVQALHVLGTTGDSDLQEIVDLAAELCDAEWSAIAILTGDDYHLLVTHGIEPLVCPRSDSLCQHMMEIHHTVAVEDARADARYAESPYVTGQLLDLRFYASAPIYAPDGVMVGRLIVCDPAPYRITPLQERALTRLAESVTAVLELRLRRERDNQRDEEEMSRIAAEIGHDMQVPLASIVGNVELLHEELRDHEDPAVSLMLARTERAAHRLLRMVEGILHFNEIGVGRSAGSVDLETVTGQVLTDLGPQLEDASAKVTVEPLPTVTGNADELYSLMQNLLSNAVKFARPRVPLEVHVRAEELGDGWRVLVTDNGVGVPEPQRERVFAMFSRVNNRVEGHGIGLATVRRIVRAHGGRVGIDEAPGGSGTQVWFEIPAR